MSCTASCTTFGGAANGVLFTLPAWPYATVDVDVTAAGTGTTLVYEQSNDNPAACASSTTWFQVSGYNPVFTNGTMFTSSNAAGHIVINTTAACFRVRVSVYGSGTVTAGAYQTNNVPYPRAVTVIGVGFGSTPAGAGQGIVTSQNPYPAAATAITASNTGTTGTVTATLPANASARTYICWFSIDAAATAATNGNATVTGSINGSLNFTQDVGISPAVSHLFRTFSPCVPSSAVNTGIAVNAIAAGAGGLTSVSAGGYQL